MKKIIISIIIVMIFFINSNSIVYGASDTWVSEAFQAAHDFINEPTTDDLGIIDPLLKNFKNIVKGINITLLVLLSSLSVISLAVIGVRYIMSGASPHQREIAKQSLHTVFIGMVYGFGAYTIWKIAMGIVELIIGAFAQS